MCHPIEKRYNYPEAPLPSYKFGDRVAVSEECAPTNWLTGKIVGLTLDETYQPIWYFSVRLDAPSGLTEEYLGDDLVLEKEIPDLQAEWEANDAIWVKENRHVVDEQNLSPKFERGMLVKFTKETGCNLVGDTAEVVSSRYVSSESWSGWIYKLTNEHLTEVIEIGEVWLQLAYPTTQSPTHQSLTEINCS
jgi:hypothetical protein